MTFNLTATDFRLAARDAWDGVCTSRNHESALIELTRVFSHTLDPWQFLTTVLLVCDLIITLYGLGAKIPDAVLPIPNEDAVVAFTELIVLIQLLKLVLPMHSAAALESLTRPQDLRHQSLCKWIVGLLGLQEAELPLGGPNTNENRVKLFGVFLFPVLVGVAWKWRRVRRRLLQIRMDEEQALVAQALLIWET
ncbi:hypothetical protein CCHL11_08700 [Colletotrichum chlorophyti]|uniref:Uncharacterized protein n=1 Tax=Colletotrichum chlorophyti TaxID=708187 RepID=A0A1Q8RHA9_9PEZI|nr:hypothetical protein CCHL11_08700 [Colletotrichum chlorophyti]